MKEGKRLGNRKPATNKPRPVIDPAPQKRASRDNIRVERLRNLLTPMYNIVTLIEQEGIDLETIKKFNKYAYDNLSKVKEALEYDISIEELKNIRG